MNADKRFSKRTMEKKNIHFHNKMKRLSISDKSIWNGIYFLFFSFVYLCLHCFILFFIFVFVVISIRFQSPFSLFTNAYHGNPTIYLDNCARNRERGKRGSEQRHCEAKNKRKRKKNISKLLRIEFPVLKKKKKTFRMLFSIKVIM